MDHYSVKYLSTSVYMQCSLSDWPTGRAVPAAAFPPELFGLERPEVLADQRPIASSEPIIPLETAEFNSADLAGDREGAMSTPWRHSRTAGLRHRVLKSLKNRQPRH